MILAGEAQRRLAHRLIDAAPAGYAVTVKENTRTTDQNARLWPSLSDVSQQVEWYGQRLTPAEWKDVFTAALKKSKVVPGIDGGFVIVGGRTSTMSKRQFSDLLALIYAFGDERGVLWSEPNPYEETT